MPLKRWRKTIGSEMKWDTTADDVNLLGDNTDAM
jgi:hypothetical protein